jgi:hypothetical protein
LGVSPAARAGLAPRPGKASLKWIKFAVPTPDTWELGPETGFARLHSPPRFALTGYAWHSHAQHSTAARSVSGVAGAKRKRRRTVSIAAKQAKAAARKLFGVGGLHR